VQQRACAWPLTFSQPVPVFEGWNFFFLGFGGTMSSYCALIGGGSVFDALEQFAFQVLAFLG